MELVTAHSPTHPHLGLDEAQQVLAAALEASRSLRLRNSVAVVDQGGNLLAYARQDGAVLATVTLCVDKASTAVAFGMPTSALARMAAPGGPVFGINAASAGRFIAIGGGVPLVLDGLVVGAVGVSGSSPDEDEEVALVAREAWRPSA